MQSNKPIQKKPKDRSNSPQHPKKEKAQKQDRYKFQLLPLPEKFVNRAKMYRLYGDLILMESDDNMIIDGSLYNYYKIYRRIEIESHESQRLVRVYLENKFDELEDWREVVEKIKNSPSSSIREWAEPIKAYCERYEDMIKEFQGEMSKEKIAKFTEINLQTKKIRHALINTYPLVECKSEFRNGHIELTQLAYSEKFIAAIGFTLEELVNAVFKNGLPMLFPLTAVGASWIAKMGVEYSLPLEPEGFRAPEYDVSFFSKDGTIKSVKSFVQYNAFLEKGVPGFFCFSMMAEQPKDCTENIKPMEKQVLTKDYANKDYEKEMEHADFLELFYGIRTEPR